MNSNIVIFDIETTVPNGDIIEFGCIVLDGRTLKEIIRYETLIYAESMNFITTKYNGIKKYMLKNKPIFSEISQIIFNLLDNNIWMGHNINRFDKHKLIKQYEIFNLKVPQPIKILDTLDILKKIYPNKLENFRLATF
jgi:DNA polymerase III epsilon subunit-like protein